MGVVQKSKYEAEIMDFWPPNLCNSCQIK